MQDKVWLDVVANARARYGDEPFELGGLWQALATLGLVDREESWDAFWQDAVRRSEDPAQATEHGHLRLLEDGSRWQVIDVALSPSLQEEASGNVESESEGEDVTQQQGEFAREVIVERQGAGVWAIFDSKVGEWKTEGKEAPTIAKARQLCKDAAAQGEGPIRFAVVGKERKIKQERVYQPRAAKAAGTPKPKAKPTPDRPPLPGEEPAPAAPAPEPTLDSSAFADKDEPEGPQEEPLAAAFAAERANGTGLTVLQTTTGQSVAVDLREVAAVEDRTSHVSVALGKTVYSIDSDFLSMVVAVNEAKAR